VKDALKVDEPVGERWDLALAVLHDGRGAVRIGPLELRRDVGGPKATEELLISIVTSHQTRSLERANEEVQNGLAVLEQLRQNHRFNELLGAFGHRCDCVADFDNALVVLAEIAPSGEVRWSQPGV
jgi:hypothetical protein